MSEISLIKQNPLISFSKDGISGIVDNYIKDIATNGGDVVKDWVTCEKYSFAIKQLQEGLKPYLIKELEYCDKKETHLLGTMVKVVGSPAKYDFSENEVWVNQKKLVDEATIKLKEIEAFIKTLKSSTTIVDEETGESFRFYPPSKSSTETIRSTME